MAQKDQSVTPTEATVMEAFLLGLADHIYATFGNSGATPDAEAVEPEAEPEPTAKPKTSKAKPKAKPEPEPEEDEEPEDEEADEVDADEDEELEAERAKLEKLSIAALRKKLVALGYDKEDVAEEKDKAVLIETILTDDDDEDDDDEEESDEDESDAAAEGYTEEKLAEMSLGELKEIAAELELDIAKNSRSATYKKAILEAQEIAEDTDADEDEDGDEDDERAALEKLTLAELRKEAKEYGFTPREIKGKDKDGLLDMIFDEDEDDEDDEEDDDEEG